MVKRAHVAPVVVLTLSGLLAYRLYAQDAYRHTPSGGSATVEGVEVTVGSRIAGRLSEVLVVEGDVVKQGQVLARIDCAVQRAGLVEAEARVRDSEMAVPVAEAELIHTQGQVKVARAETASTRARERAMALEQAQAARDAARALQLSNAGAVTQVEREHSELKRDGADEHRREAEAGVHIAMASASSASNAVAVANARIAEARANVELARAELTRRQIDVGECTLIAPRDGRVAERLLEPGAVVEPGTRVIELIDVSTAKLTFYLPNGEIGRVAFGQPAEVRPDALPDRVFVGKVHYIASEAEFTPRNVQTREDRDRLVYAVEVHVDNTEGLLRAGMPADVLVPGTER